MPHNSKPKRWDWQPLVKGSTRRAATITSTDSDVILSRVVVTIEEYGSDSAKIILDSDATGVTINNGAAGAWSFTVGPIAAATTAGLAVKMHTINMTLTDNSGNVLEPVVGKWPILAK